MATSEQSHAPMSREEMSSTEHSAESSNNPSRESSRAPKVKPRVRFTPGGESLDNNNQRSAFDVRDEARSLGRPTIKPRPAPKQSVLHRRSQSTGSVVALSDSNVEEDATASPKSDRGFFDNKEAEASEPELDDEDSVLEMKSPNAGLKAYSQQSAQDRAERLSRMMGSHSAPATRTASPLRSPPPSPPLGSPPPSPPLEGQAPPLDLDSIPMGKLQSRRTYGIDDETTDDEEKNKMHSSRKKRRPFHGFIDAATRLVTRIGPEQDGTSHISPPATPRSGQVTPVQDRTADYVPRPQEYREGLLSSLLKLYNTQGLGSALSHNPVGDVAPPSSDRRHSAGESMLGSETGELSPSSSGTTTPRGKRHKWYKNQHASSTGSISNLVHSTTVLAHPGGSPATAPSGQATPVQRPTPLRRGSSSALDLFLGRKKAQKHDQSIHIQFHIAETMTRQAYLMKMCRALMNYGAPTHRLEGML